MFSEHEELTVLQDIQRAAFLRGDLKGIIKARKAIVLLCEIRILHTAFLQARGRIKSGVAEKLNTTRNGVYFRLEKVGLDAEDMRTSTCLLDVIKKSCIGHFYA